MHETIGIVLFAREGFLVIGSDKFTGEEVGEIGGHRTMNSNPPLRRLVDAIHCDGYLATMTRSASNDHFVRKVDIQRLAPTLCRSQESEIAEQVSGEV